MFQPLTLIIILLIFTHQALEFKFLGISDLAITCVWDGTALLLVVRSVAVEAGFWVCGFAFGGGFCVEGVEAEEHVDDCLDISFVDGRREEGRRDLQRKRRKAML